MLYGGRSSTSCTDVNIRVFILDPDSETKFNSGGLILTIGSVFKAVL